MNYLCATTHSNVTVTQSLSLKQSLLLLLLLCTYPTSKVFPELFQVQPSLPKVTFKNDISSACVRCPIAFFSLNQQHQSTDISIPQVPEENLLC